MNEESVIYETLLEWARYNALNPSFRRISRATWAVCKREPERYRKPSINIPVCGPYASGKSTLLGNLLFLKGQVEHSILSKLEGLSPLERNRCIIDRSADEMANGRTQDISHRDLEYKRYRVNFINTPGKRSLIRNRISGIAQGDHMLVVVEPDSETTQIFEVLRMARIFQGASVIVAVNKLDSVQAEDCGMAAYNETVERITPLLKHANIYSSQIIPVSAKNGMNVYKKGFDWYEGPSLNQALKSLSIPRVEPNRPLRIMIDKSYRVRGVGTVVCGTIISGSIANGQLVKVGPINKIVRVKSLHLATPKRPIDKGYTGDYVAINLPGLASNETYGRRFGMVTGCVSHDHTIAYEDGGKQEYAALTPKRFYVSSLKIEPTLPELKYKKKESSLHACSSFKAVCLFFGIPQNQKVKNGAQLTMQCHNSQVQIHLKNLTSWTSTTFSQKLLENSTTSPPNLDGSTMATLSSDLLVLLFTYLAPEFSATVLPLVSKQFLAQSLKRELWQYYVATEYPGVDPRSERLPELGIPRGKQEWMYYALDRALPKSAVSRGQMAVFEVVPFARPLGIETYLNCPKLGTFVLRNGNELLGAGKIVDTNFSEKNPCYYYQ